MNFLKKSNEAWKLMLTTSVDLTGRAEKARLIIKKNKNDIDSVAVYNQEVAVADPAVFEVVFTVSPAVTHTLSGQYFYEIWTYRTDKTDAILCDSGTIIFTNPLLDTL